MYGMGSARTQNTEHIFFQLLAHFFGGIDLWTPIDDPITHTPNDPPETIKADLHSFPFELHLRGEMGRGGRSRVGEGQLQPISPSPPACRQTFCSSSNLALLEQLVSLICLTRKLPIPHSRMFIWAGVKFLVSQFLLIDLDCTQFYVLLIEGL